MIRLRNSVKALIRRDGAILLVRKRDAETGQVYYVVPGGGQEPGETFVETAKRECLEELGAEVEVGDLVLVREYIGRNHEFADKDGDVHQIEYIFLCTLASPPEPSRATHPDTDQLGAEWIPFADLKTKDLYPKILKDAIGKDGRIACPVYLGDVN